MLSFFPRRSDGHVFTAVCLFREIWSFLIKDLNLNAFCKAGQHKSETKRFFVPFGKILNRLTLVLNKKDLLSCLSFYGLTSLEKNSSVKGLLATGRFNTTVNTCVLQIRFSSNACVCLIKCDDFCIHIAHCFTANSLRHSPWFGVYSYLPWWWSLRSLQLAPNSKRRDVS